MTKDNQPSTVVGIAWFRPDEWSALKEYCEDRETMDPTYQLWKQEAERAIKDLRSKGVKVEAVDFNLEEFKMWCSANAKPSTAASRSEFTSLKLRDAHRK